MQAPKPYREERPWGEFVEFTRNTPSTVKIITVKPGESLSLQRHHNRDEFWRVLDGAGSVTVGDQSLEASAGAEFFIPRETNHRMTAADGKSLVVLEISTGNFSDEDIERLEDKYGRA